MPLQACPHKHIRYMCKSLVNHEKLVHTIRDIYQQVSRTMYCRTLMPCMCSLCGFCLELMD
uniref:Uncharacterized protein n=1 Tax=Glycine max TaxID=3847 RepID=C6T616_SOYBN|nr:unknown [Glycine max]